jgi:hypothetical protein
MCEKGQDNKAVAIKIAAVFDIKYQWQDTSLFSYEITI